MASSGEADAPCAEPRTVCDHIPSSTTPAANPFVDQPHDRTDDNQYGMHWGGPLQSISGATQQSAVDLLLAAQPIKHPAAEVTTGSS